METVHIKFGASADVNWKKRVTTSKVSTHQRVLQGFQGMFVLFYSLYYPSIFLTLQIRMFIIAGAVKIKFVSYNAQLM